MLEIERSLVSVNFLSRIAPVSLKLPSVAIRGSGFPALNFSGLSEAKV
jgi:hypothetical protein